MLVQGCGKELPDLRITGLALMENIHSMSRIQGRRFVPFGTSAPQNAGHLDQFRDKAMDLSPCGEVCGVAVYRVWRERFAEFPVESSCELSRGPHVGKAR